MSFAAEVASQRSLALERANAVKRERERLLGVKGAKVTPDVMVGLLLEMPTVLMAMEIERLLLRTQGWGRSRVQRLLAQERISTSRRLRDLSPRQRRQLAERLGA